MNVKKWLKRIFLGLLGLVLIALLSAVYVVRSAWPTTDGTLKFVQLDGEVEIIRDEYGIAHIYADNDHDLLFGQGYVQAQDRLWQMEFNRRLASGTLSEVLGEQLLGFDAFFRNVELRVSAEKSLRALQPEDLALLQAFSDGVNAYIDHNRRNLPVEFRIFRYTPSAWTPLDSLTYGNAISLQLGGNRRLELLRGHIVDQFGAEVMNMLLPSAADTGDIKIPPAVNAYKGLAQLDLEQFAGLDNILGSPLDGVGSNAWVVNGDHTASGMPIIANDIHLGQTMPSVFYANGLHGGSFDVTGYTLLGVPLVLSGHNQTIAWGVTNLAPDTQDWYLERLDDRENPTMYEYEGEMLPLETREEVIKIKGGTTETIQIYQTASGTLMNGTLGKEESLPMSLRRTAQDANHLFHAIVNLNQASNWETFRSALSFWDIPGQNILYADVEGNIGYQTTGKVPIRTAGQGLIPMPGWTGDYRWDGTIPYDEMPRAFNPESGIIVNANSRVTEADYPYYLTDSYVPGYRAARIQELLEANNALSVDAMLAIQLDTLAKPSEIMLPYWDVITTSDAVEAAALASVNAWDGRYEIDSLGAAIYEKWHSTLLKNIIEDNLGEAVSGRYIAGHYMRHATQHMPMLTALMEDPNNTWFDDGRTADLVETRDDLVQRSFEETVVWMREMYGDDVQQWTWGAKHTVSFPHAPFGNLNLPIITDLFNSDTYSVRGSNFAIHSNAFDANDPFAVRIISNVRYTLDLADFDGGMMLPSTGQSMHIFHPHREDLNVLWAAGDSIPMRFDRTTIEAEAQQTLYLMPSK